VKTLNQVQLSAGPIEYTDTGGPGPTVVLVPGLSMNGSVWRKVVSELSGVARCLVPTLPLGGHRQPMHPDADLSPRAVGLLVAEFLDALDLRDVTLVGNDSGLFLFAAVERPQRLRGLIITSCEAFENFPPGLPGTGLWRAARVPGGVSFLVNNLRLRPLRRLPIAFGWMSRRPVPAEVADDWLEPLFRQRAIRRDLVRYLRAAKKKDLLALVEPLRSFDRPTLVVWAADDRVMPPEHGQRFADLIPGARLVTVPDSYTLIPEDQPAVLAGHIRDFLAAQPEPRAPGQPAPEPVSRAGLPVAVPVRLTPGGRSPR
jgi:pimeloyl-ACP methyl ester carboxylesterase